MHGHKVADVAATIEQMTGRVRLAQSVRARPEPGWWLTLCGQPLDPEDFEQREHARQMLAQAAGKLGLEAVERVWVWDKASRAQLVVGAYTTRPAAERAQSQLAPRAQTFGLLVKLIRAWD